MQDEATSRAREVLRYARGEDDWLIGAVATQNILDALTVAGFQIIDTRTHAAIAREPSDADVERVFCVLAWGSPKRPPELADDEQIARAMAGNPPLVRKARAAIAALVAAQTQGGERDAPP